MGATCFADKNEATIRGLKDKKGSKVSIKSSKSKSDKSSKFSNNPKPGLKDTKGQRFQSNPPSQNLTNHLSFPRLQKQQRVINPRVVKHIILVIVSKIIH